MGCVGVTVRRPRDEAGLHPEPCRHLPVLRTRMTRVQCQHGYWVNPLPRFTGAKADIFHYSALESRATDPDHCDMYGARWRSRDGLLVTDNNIGAIPIRPEVDPGSTAMLCDEQRCDIPGTYSSFS